MQMNNAVLCKLKVAKKTLSSYKADLLIFLSPCLEIVT